MTLHSLRWGVQSLALHQLCKVTWSGMYVANQLLPVQLHGFGKGIRR